MANLDLNLIWNIVDNLKESKFENLNIESIKICKNCQTEIKDIDDVEITCNQCGVIQNRSINFSNNVVYEIPQDIKPVFNKYSKLQKMQEWYKWTNDEKNNYKLVNYTKNLCNKLEIHESFIDNITYIVSLVIQCIKKHDGTKRGNVKNGIILACIQYTTNISSLSLAKKLELDIKYVSKAETLILELISNGKLDLNKNFIDSHTNIVDDIIGIIYKHHILISSKISLELQTVINICNTFDLLTDHTPLSIGIACFYYILQKHNNYIDIKIFAEWYSISIVTITKILNKINTYENFIKSHL